MTLPTKDKLNGILEKIKGLNNKIFMETPQSLCDNPDQSEEHRQREMHEKVKSLLDSQGVELNIMRIYTYYKFKPERIENYWSFLGSSNQEHEMIYTSLFPNEEEAGKWTKLEREIKKKSSKN